MSIRGDTRDRLAAAAKAQGRSMASILRNLADSLPVKGDDTNTN